MRFAKLAVLGAFVAVNAQTDCVGSWSDCGPTCLGNTTYTITTPATNGGIGCAYADQTTRTCTDGDACDTTKKCRVVSDVEAYCTDASLFGCADVTLERPVHGPFSGRWFVPMVGVQGWTVDFSATSMPIANNPGQFTVVEKIEMRNAWTSWDAAYQGITSGGADIPAQDIHFTINGNNLKGWIKGYCVNEDDSCIDITIVDDQSSNGPRAEGKWNGKWASGRTDPFLPLRSNIIFSRCLPGDEFQDKTARCLPFGQIWRDATDTPGSKYIGYDCVAYETSGFCGAGGNSEFERNYGFVGNQACCACSAGGQNGGEAVVDCLGTWGTCSVGCMQDWTTTALPIRGGAPCPSEQQECDVGEGDCVTLPSCNPPAGGTGINNTDCGTSLPRNSNCDQSCLPGYDTVDPSAGAWACGGGASPELTGTAITCNAASCLADFGEGVNMSQCQDFVTDSSCTLSCRDGYTFTGQDTVFTCPEGKLSQGNFSCSAASCGNLTVAGSPIASQPGRTGESLYVYCYDGYMAELDTGRVNSFNAECAATGPGTSEWMYSDCVELACPGNSTARNESRATVNAGCLCPDGESGRIIASFSDSGYTSDCTEIPANSQIFTLAVTFNTGITVGNWTSALAQGYVDAIVLRTGVASADEVAIVEEGSYVNEINANETETLAFVTLRIKFASEYEAQKRFDSLDLQNVFNELQPLYAVPLELRTVTVAEPEAFKLSDAAHLAPSLLLALLVAVFAN